MVTAVRQKLTYVLESRITMAAPTIPEFIVKRKFLSILEHDEEADILCPAFEKRVRNCDANV